MFNIQEVEELEYCPQLEHQNAYSQSCIETDRTDDREKIADLISQGKWIVISYSDVCCPYTDAGIFTAVYIVEVFDNEGSAQKHYDEIANDCCESFGIEGPRNLQETDIVIPNEVDDIIPF